MIFTINSHTCFLFYCFPTISRAAAPKKCTQSVETVEIIIADFCCRLKIARLCCFNEGQLQIGQTRRE